VEKQAMFLGTFSSLLLKGVAFFKLFKIHAWVHTHTHTHTHTERERERERERETGLKWLESSLITCAIARMALILLFCMKDRIAQ
jgi:hypothetical protein